MPINTNGYRDFGIGLGVNDVAYPHSLEIRIDPQLNNGADVLCLYTGTLVFAAKGKTAQAWHRGSMAARVPTPGRRWSPTTIARGPGWTIFMDGSVVLSLASIYNAGTANYAGWAVDAAIVEAVTPAAVPQPDDHLQIQALIAVRDSDGYLNRLAYQVSALGRTI